MDSVLVSITDFRRNAGSYLDQLELGQSFIIIRDSKPLGDLIPRNQKSPAQTLADDLAKIKRLGGNLHYKKILTPKQMNNAYDKQYEKLLPR